MSVDVKGSGCELKEGDVAVVLNGEIVVLSMCDLRADSDIELSYPVLQKIAEESYERGYSDGYGEGLDTGHEEGFLFLSS